MYIWLRWKNNRTVVFLCSWYSWLINSFVNGESLRTFFFFYAHFFKWRPRLKNRKLTAVSWISVLQSNNLTVGSKIITVIEKGRRMNLKWTKGIRYVFSLKENDCKSLIVKVQLVWCTSVVHLCLSFPYFIFRSVCFWIPVYAAPAVCKLQGKI